MLTFGPAAARVAERDPVTHWRRGGVLLTVAAAACVVYLLDAGDAPGKRLLSALVGVNAVALGVLAAAGGLAAVSSGRRTGRLAALVLAEPNPRRLAVNLAAPAVLSAWTLLAAQLPVGIFAVAAGGVAVWQVVTAFAVLAAWVVLAAAVGTWEAAYSRDGAGALAAAAAAVGLLSLCLGVPRWLTGLVGVDSHPLCVLWAVLDGGLRWGGGYPVVAATLAWLAFGLAGRTILHAAERPADVSLPSTPESEEPPGAWRASIPVGDRYPHRWRGWHFHVGGWRGVARRVGGFAAVTAAVALASPFGWLMAMIVGLCALAISEVSFGTARLVAGETADRQGELLLLLPSEPSDVAEGLRWSGQRIQNVVMTVGIGVLMSVNYGMMTGRLPFRSMPITGLVCSVVLAVGATNRVAGGLAFRLAAATAAGAGFAVGVTTLAFGWWMTATAMRVRALTDLDTMLLKLLAGIGVPLLVYLASITLLPKDGQPLEAFARQLIVGVSPKRSWDASARPVEEELEEAPPLGSRTAAR